MDNKNIKNIFKYIILVLKGVLVGFGAIMPGISGGTLCVSFGMYTPLLNVMSHPIKALREDGLKLLMFVLGGCIGFVGLSGLAGWLMSINSTVVVLVFVGFIIGTFPDLWKIAGEKGRNKFSYLYMVIGFVFLLELLKFFSSDYGFTLEPGFPAFLICGILWGLSFIVPGLSSSTLIMFFGLYQPMLEGIATLSLPVVLPLLIGGALCLILVSKGVNAMYERWHSAISHTIIGVVAASMVMVIPFSELTSSKSIIIALVSVIAGAFVSYFLSKLCDKLT